MAPEPLYLGVDIGGTKVAAGLVSGRGKILSRARVPMSANGAAAAALAAVVEAARQARAGHDAPLAGVGVSSPGPLDPRKGIVLNPPNLRCWRNYPLAKHLGKALGAPVHLDNDANAAALAEARWGAGRGFASVFYATLGTGIGAGLVLGNKALDGKIYHGRTGAAVEGGHLSIDRRGPLCGCGKRGCIEAYASGPALARRAHAENAELVAQAWSRGDKKATALLASTAELLAIWLGNIVDVLEPDVIIFGGGMGELWSQWFPEIKKTIPAWSINRRAHEIPLRLARYRAEAGIAGGAALCL